jgi:hypothetical protein
MPCLHVGACRRLNGLASGVVTVVKGCLLKPLQERWAAKQAQDESDQKEQYCQSAFDYINFEPRYILSNIFIVNAMLVEHVKLCNLCKHL